MGPDTHVLEEKHRGEQAQSQKLWGARPRLLLSCLHVEKDARVGKRARQTPRAEKLPCGVQRAGQHSGVEHGLREVTQGENRDARSLVAVLGQAIDTARADELLVLDLFLEETLQLLYIDFCNHWACHHKHLQHAVDPLQGQALEVGQHGLDVRPEQLQSGTRRNSKSHRHLYHEEKGCFSKDRIRTRIG